MFTGSKEECRNYHKVMLRDSFYKIGPFTVLSHQIGIVVATPASMIGKGVGDFIASLLGKYFFVVH